MSDSNIKFATRPEVLRALRHGKYLGDVGDSMTSIYRFEGHDYYITPGQATEVREISISSGIMVPHEAHCVPGTEGRSYHDLMEEMHLSDATRALD